MVSQCAQTIRPASIQMAHTDVTAMRGSLWSTEVASLALCAHQANVSV